MCNSVAGALQTWPVAMRYVVHARCPTAETCLHISSRADLVRHLLLVRRLESSQQRRAAHLRHTPSTFHHS